MQNPLFPELTFFAANGGLQRAHAAPPRPDRHERENSANRQFLNMLGAFHRTGGIARVEEVVQLFNARGGPKVEILATWIERRQVICFKWRLDIWLPWFQFHRAELVPHPQLSPIFSELTPVFDPWEMATWFAHPNPWLAERTPVHMLVIDLPAVLTAARADRFIADG